MNRHLTLIPGRGDELPAGTLRPTRSHVALRKQATQAGHPCAPFDHEQHPDRPVLNPLTATSMQAVLGLVHHVEQLAVKYGNTLPADEWVRLRNLAISQSAPAAHIVGCWIDGDPTPGRGTPRPSC